ncbi:MAG: hypothetical protein Gaeavirus1_20 [Gaeavirus sp.]|uniref:Uncharacterized protein n=1 Tax=Gaeavirus sp. TaxID=2487767 RepID=A0A3G5A204_9VIRU|nr:MAG: hypothetical protein Gaeavirus1_20 [Gaeavirus sp.]
MLVDIPESCLATVDGLRSDGGIFDTEFDSRKVRILYINGSKDGESYIRKWKTYADELFITNKYILDYDLRKYVFSGCVESLKITNYGSYTLADISFMTNLKDITICEGSSSTYSIILLSDLIFPVSLEKISIDYVHRDIMSNTVFPENLKILAIWKTCNLQIKNIVLPIGLKELHLGSSDSLQYISLPIGLKKLGISSIADFIMLDKIETHENLKKIIVGFIDDVCVECVIVKIPMSVTHIDIFYSSFLKHMIFESPITKLTLRGSVDNLDDLPYGLEKLILWCGVPKIISNLPMCLRKIKLNDFIDRDSNAFCSKIERLPYGCIVVNKNGKILRK